jgi:hypothetical protein
MALTRRGLLLGVLGLGLVVVVSKARSHGVGASSGTKIKNAVYATPIPVYPGAKLRDIGGGNYYDEIGGPVTFTSTAWFFDVKDPVAKVADYYANHLPAGATPKDVEEGEVGFEWIPPGAAEGELVSVTVREGEVQIGETVKAGKAPPRED